MDDYSLRFVEEALYLVTLGPWHAGYDVLQNTIFNREKAQALTVAVEACWESIYERDISKFGASIRAGFEAQIARFPNMMNAVV